MCTLRLQTRVLNVAPNTGGTIISNTFTVDYRTSGTAAPTVTSPNATLTLFEPSLHVSKTVLSASPATGQATFRVTLTNTAGTTGATAYLLRLTDTLPAGLAFVSHTTPPAPSGVVNPAISVSSTTPTTLTLTADSVPPGTSYSFDIVTRGDGTVGPGTTVTNPVTLTASDLSAADNPNPDQGDPNSRRTYTVTSSASVTAPPLGFTKTAAPCGDPDQQGHRRFHPEHQRAGWHGAVRSDRGRHPAARLALRGPGITYSGNPGAGCGPATPSDGGMTAR